MTTISAEQFRIEQVQILNWGGYCGLQVMRAGRGSTAILGPSGRGKSTLLDAMASVIMSMVTARRPRGTPIMVS